MDIRRGVILPNLLTVGNGVCGFAAIVKALKVGVIEDTASGVLRFDHPELFATAAWFILLGMVFDVFDGKVARLAGRTSDLGAQLDSLCDLTTFGIAPAILVVRLNMIYDPAWGKAVWFFSLAYFLGALLRLARFNAENEHDESAHLCFKGLPSPAAAGCVASLIIFYFQKPVQGFVVDWIPWALPVLVLILGYTMVSTRLKYAHVASQIFNRRHSFQFLVWLIFGGIIVALFLDAALPLGVFLLPLGFIGYLAWTPAAALLRRLRKKPAVGTAPEEMSGPRVAEFFEDPPLDRR